MVEVVIPHTKEPILNDISEFNLEKNDLSTSAFLLTAQNNFPSHKNSKEDL